MRPRPHLRRFARSARGTSAVEFAIVLPVMLLFVGGIIEMGRAFQVYSAVNRLATRYALAWADCSDTTVGVCQTELALYVTPGTLQNMAPQLTNTITVRMLEVKMTGTAATVVYSYPLAATPTASELTLAQKIIGSGQTGVIATVTYPHTLVFFAPLMTPIMGASRSVSYTVAQRKS